MQNKTTYSLSESLRVTLERLMKKDKRIILFGEGIDDNSAMFQTTKGLTKLFGKERVVEMPLSENCFTGAAIGSSILGDKVVVNLQRVEFSLLALEQIFNNAAKIYYGSNGQHMSRTVFRMVVGRGWGQGPVHAQSLESVFSSIPGLKVFMPVFPSEGCQLLAEAINDNNPVIFIEHRWCHYNLEKFNPWKINLSQKINAIKKLSNGKDLSIVSNGYHSSEIFTLLKIFKKFGISIDHLHLRKLNPLEIDAVYSSLKKTGRLLIVDSGQLKQGINSEILSRVFEKGLNLKLPPIRMGLPDHPVPSSRGFIKSVYPNYLSIAENIFKLLNIKKDKSLKIFNQIDSIIKRTSVDVPINDFKGPF